MDPLRRLGALTGWLVGLAGVVAVMHALGRGDLAAPDVLAPSSWSDWAGGRTAPQAAMAVVRLVVLVLAWYLLAVTVLAAAVRLGRAGRLVSMADVVTLPFVRSLVQAGLGLGVAGVTVAAVGSLASPPTGPPTLTDAALAAHHAPHDGGADAPVLRRLPVADTVADAGPPVLRRLPEPLPTPVAVARATWSVGPGDHLWSIATHSLLDAWGRVPTITEVVPHWERLVEENRPSLADPANPDLLFPGQELVLPPPPPAP